MLGQTSAFGQALVDIVVGLVIVGLPLLVAYLVRLGRTLERVLGVLITPAPTPLVPNPPKGLVDVVEDLARTSKATLAGTAVLVRETRTDDGRTQRDQLDRIEKQTKPDDK